MRVEGLEVCPFCKGEIEMWPYEFGTVKVFECKKCRTRFIFPWDKDISEWNRRAGEEDAGQAPERQGNQ